MLHNALHTIEVAQDVAVLNGMLGRAAEEFDANSACYKYNNLCVLASYNSVNALCLKISV